MRGIIDRFENGFVVVELDNGTVNIPLGGAPEGLREGLVVEVSGTQITAVDEEAAARRSAALHRRFLRLKRKK